MPTLTTTIERELTVEYEYSKAQRGARDSMGVPEEPDEPESVEILSVKDSDGKDFDLNNEERESIERQCLEDHADAEEAAAEDRADAQREDRLLDRLDRTEGCIGD